MQTWLLIESARDLVIIDQLFLNNFHGVDALCSLLRDDKHLGVAAATDYFDELKVFETDDRAVGHLLQAPQSRT